MLLTRTSIYAAFWDSLAKLDPRVQFRNAETLGVYVGSIFTTIVGISLALFATAMAARAAFFVLIAAWLWTSILLANFAEAIAVELLKARATALRSTGGNVRAKRLLGTSRDDYRLVDVDTLRRGDIVLVEAGDIIPADATVIEGAASVSEAAVTGESAPVLRAAQRGLCFVLGGSHLLSDWLVVRVRSRAGFFDPIVTIEKVAERSRTPQEIALSIMLTVTTIGLLIGISLLSGSSSAGPGGILARSVLVALLVCSMPIVTRVSVFVLGAVSLVRLRRANVIATTGSALEAAADIDVLVMDKTGTITRGDRHAVAFHATPGIDTRDLLDVAMLTSLADETPEGRSIVTLVRQMTDSPARDLSGKTSTFHEFSAQSRISGIDLEGRNLRKGAPDTIRRFAEQAGGNWPVAVSELIDRVARAGDTPLVIADGPRVLGVIELHDVVKVGIREYCVELRRMGIRTIMVTGDNPLTATTIAAEIGVDEFHGEATPEKKCELIQALQKEGHRVAMYGDGTNDAPALAQADVAVAMNTGTKAAKDVGQLLDLDSDPTKFSAIVRIARQMLTLRRSLTTFSISADLAKYLAITPVVFAATYPALNALNVTGLASPRSAMLSAALFNVLLIVPLQWLVVRGSSARAESAARFSRTRLWIYGLGGILLSWAGIKLIDICIQ